MKKTYGVFMSVVTVVCSAQLANAAEVTGLNVFVAGEKARAADVNANFTAVKSAVDDNNARILTKQERITGSCAVGSSIRAIAADGTVTCEANTDTLESLSCTDQQVVQWNGSLNEWTCVDYVPAPQYTMVNYATEITTNSVTSTYQPFATLGSFNKVYDTSLIEIQVIDHARTDGVFCDFQLRVDDNAMSGGAARAVLYGADAPISITGWFPSLTAGTHTISLWIRGVATSCTLNPGSFQRTVFVKEIPGAVVN